MNDKVYLVTCEQGCYDDFGWSIHSICHALSRTKMEKKKLEDYVTSIKDKYEQAFNSDFDFDREHVMELDIETRWEQVYEFERLYPELKYHTIRIEEKTIL